MYRNILRLDPTSVEAMSCLGTNYFYTDRPEVAIRFYRRLVQMGFQDFEVWNNLGLCSYFASQYDITLSCFERALDLVETDEDSAKVWYNISHVAIGTGDLQLAYQSLRICVASDPNHAEAYNNMGVLELRRGRTAQARSHFDTAQRLCPQVYESQYNGALLSYRKGELEVSHSQLNRSLSAYPEHVDSGVLMGRLRVLLSDSL